MSATRFRTPSPGRPQSESGSQLRTARTAHTALRWAPYSWASLPIVALISFSRYGWPVGGEGWLPLLALGLALVAMERGCLVLFSLASAGRSHSRDLIYQVTLALGFALSLWCFREFMNQSLGVG